MARDNKFIITLKDFHAGFAPLAFLNSLTELGSKGAASAMANADVIGNDSLTQGPALSDLTNGNQAGVVTELINFIMDKAVSAGVSFAIGATKLFKLSSTTVSSGGSPSWPRTIANATQGTSVIDLRGNLYYFFNKASGGDIGKYDLASSFDDDWASTVPTGAAALQSAPHPVAAKEDIMVFGNGRYLGTYFDLSTTLDVDKLDFGAGQEVADVIFDSGFWWIAVNSGVTGTNRTSGQIFLYDGAAQDATLADETGVGVQRIGFLYRLNGVKYVAYQDLSMSGGFIIGYIAGSQIKPLGRFSGTLPNYQQKTLYKNTILFLSSGLVYSGGAVIDELPFQLSQHADGGHATVGAIAAPFGTPMVSSSDGASNHRLAQFSGYDTTCTWRSLVIPTIAGRFKGFIDEVVVLTKTLGANARCDLKIETDQASASSSTKNITGTGKRRFVFKNFGLPPGGIEDFRVFLNWANGNATNPCPIRQMQIMGHYVKK